jgi:hypothetical protein
MSVYAGERATPANLVFSTAARMRMPARDRLADWIAPEHPSHATRILDIAGRPWLVEVAARRVPSLADHLASLAMLAGGIL